MGSNPVVFFQRPENWDQMTDEEQTEYALQLAEQMGFTD